MRMVFVCCHCHKVYDFAHKNIQLNRISIHLPVRYVKSICVKLFWWSKFRKDFFISYDKYFVAFLQREDGKRCHGFSLIFYEEVRNQDICNAMHTLQVGFHEMKLCCAQREFYIYK